MFSIMWLAVDDGHAVKTIIGLLVGSNGVDSAGRILICVV